MVGSVNLTPPPYNRDDCDLMVRFALARRYNGNTVEWGRNHVTSPHALVYVFVSCVHYSCSLAQRWWDIQVYDQRQHDLAPEIHQGA